MNYTKLNPEFQHLEIDHLYHLGFDSTMNLAHLAGNIKQVIFTRSFNNASRIASELTKKVYGIAELEIKCQPIGKTERYYIYHVQNSLIVSHGIGTPSLLICLNEVVKLLWHAQAQDVNFFRISPAGGLGVAPGSIVIGTQAVDNTLTPKFKSIEFGEVYEYATDFDAELNQTLLQQAKIPITLGKIIGGLDFYNGQARLNGAIPLTYTAHEQQSYLDHAYSNGVRSLDMESLGFAGFCQQLDIRCCEINVVLTNRLESDQITLNKTQQLAAFNQAVHLVTDYILNG